MYLVDGSGLFFFFKAVLGIKTNKASCVLTLFFVFSPLGEIYEAQDVAQWLEHLSYLHQALGSSLKTSPHPKMLPGMGLTLRSFSLWTPSVSHINCFCVPFLD